MAGFVLKALKDEYGSGLLSLDGVNSPKVYGSVTLSTVPAKVKLQWRSTIGPLASKSCSSMVLPEQVRMGSVDLVHKPNGSAALTPVRTREMRSMRVTRRGAIVI